jgi:hypothetical protein
VEQLSNVAERWESCEREISNGVGDETRYKVHWGWGWGFN